MVNRHSGICARYHRFHDNSRGFVKLLSWAYLLWLNFAFYILQFRFLDRAPEVDVYEAKRLEYRFSETYGYHKRFPDLNVDSYIKQCEKYDIISFDIFDTLIFRPMAVPVDMFYLMGEHLAISDYKNIRTFAEYDARLRCMMRCNHAEINLEDIHKNLSEDVGIDYKESMKEEIDVELSFCYANPFMKQVWNRLRRMNKRIIVTTDMYLPYNVIEKILGKNGYTGYERIYLSNIYHKSKADGKLYGLVLRDYPEATILHIGDNPYSDIKMAKKHKIDSRIYPNVNRNVLLYRSMDMSYIIGSAYRGIVSTYLYNGLKIYSQEYEYGFIYGGLFVLGYCHFIHEYTQSHNIDKILFLSRDGETLMKAYISMYPDEADKCSYVYWSRKCATKLMASCDKHDYFRRFIYHKVNQGYTIAKILKTMELEGLISQLSDWKEISDKWNEANLNAKHLKKTKFINLQEDDELTDKNGYLLRRFIEAKWEYVESVYREQMDAACRYYKKVLKDCAKAVAVDIGWAGSGALSMSYLVEKQWNLSTDITGIIAGTNTINNSEADSSETFLQNGRLVSYMFSTGFNRDIWKKHNPSKDYNVFWELLLSSPKPQFIGFYNNKPLINKSEYSVVKIDDIYLRFGSSDDNIEGIKDIRQGILDFVSEYMRRFKSPLQGRYTYMYNISGRDAYAPMLLAASNNERYLKTIMKKFKLVVNVD